MYATRLRAFYNPFIGFLPQPRARGDPARRRPPGDRRHAHARRLHRLLRLPADADRADAPARHRARPRRSARPPRARGVFELLDREPRIVVAGGRAAAARGRRARGAARRLVRLRGRLDAGAARHRPRPSRRARRSRWSAPPARARPRSCSCSAALYDVTDGAVLIDGADVRDVDLRLAARADRGRRRRPVPVLGHRARQHRLRAAGRDPRGGRAGGRARAGGGLHRRAARRLRHASSASAG